MKKTNLKTRITASVLGTISAFSMDRRSPSSTTKTRPSWLARARPLKEKTA